MLKAPAMRVSNTYTLGIAALALMSFFGCAAKQLVEPEEDPGNGRDRGTAAVPAKGSRAGTGTGNGNGTGTGNGTGNGNGTGAGNGSGNGAGTANGNENGNGPNSKLDAGVVPLGANDSSADAAIALDAAGGDSGDGGQKTFGSPCVAAIECASSACFVGKNDSYCSLKCAVATAAADCPVPLTSGTCNNQGFCKK
jgi:hypothetical protein